MWRGGNSIIVADIFKRYSSHRRVYLYDTFAGMREPTIVDMQKSDGAFASKKYEKAHKRNRNEWCHAPLDDVSHNLESLSLLRDSVFPVKGDVQNTLKEESNYPEKKSLLRLNTDWYESTSIELDVLWPRL